MSTPADDRDVPGYDEAIARFVESFDETAVPARLRMAVARETARQLRLRMVRRAALTFLPLACAVVAIFVVSSGNEREGQRLGGVTAPAEALICPHGSSAPSQVLKTNAKSPVKFEEFLKAPDRFKRVCYCRPSFSGSLRERGDTVIQ